MSKFDLLTRHIPELTGGNYGKAVDSLFNSGHAGTTEDPIPMPYMDYSEAVNSLHRDIYDFCEAHPEYEHTDYHKTLEENGLKWDMGSMTNADVSKMDAKAVIALLIGACRAEHFCDGALMDFLENGCIIRWLKRLESLDGNASIICVVSDSDQTALTTASGAFLRRIASFAVSNR